MKIGIMGAMDIEVSHLVGELTNPVVQEHMGMTFNEGLLNGTPVVVVMCGDGKVNAAVCASVLIDRYGVTAVINTGVAGSLDARIDIGDLVVSTDVVHHDMDVTPLGYAPGQVPGMDTLSFAADEGLRTIVVRVVRKVAPQIAVFEGRVVSGDQFVGSPERKEWIVNTFGGLCCEMEGAAIAHVCHIAHVPFVIVRTISDKADGSAEMDYPTFKIAAARLCAAIVEHCVASAEVEALADGRGIG